MAEYRYAYDYDTDIEGEYAMLATRRTALKARSYLHRLIRDYNAIDNYPDFEQWIEISDDKDVTSFYNMLVTNRSLRNDIKSVYWLWINYIK